MMSTCDQTLRQAEEATRQGDLAAASAHFLEVYLQDPNSLQAILGLSRCALGQGMLAQAESLLEAAAALGPGDPDVAIFTGVWHEMRLELDAAENAYKEGVAGHPGAFIGHFNLARLLALRKSTKEAVRHYRHALRIDPRQPKVHFGLGLCHIELGQPGEAVRSFGRALEYDPLFEQGYLTLVGVLEGIGERDAARKCILQGLSALPGSVELWKSATLLLLRNAEFAAAKTQLEALLELDPQNEWALLQLTATELMLGELQNALNASMQVVEFNPGSVPAQFNVAAIYELAKQSELAEKHYREALRLDDRHWGSLTNLGLILVCRDDDRSRREGVGLLEKSRELAAPGELRPLLNLAMGHWQAGDRVQALDCADTLIRTAPADSDLSEEAIRFLAAARAAA